MTALPRPRWWWTAGVVWLLLYGALMAVLTSGTPFRRWMFGGAPWSLFAAITPGLLGIAWLVVIAPMLEAGVPHFTDRWPARRRARLCFVFAWVPTAVFGVLLIQVVVVRIAGVDHFGWFGRGYPLVVLCALVLSIFYGRIMIRRMQHRIRASVATAARCWWCNYDLRGGGGDHCPECGRIVG